MSEWRVMTLREAGVVLIDCDHRTPPAAESGYPYIAIPQLKQGRLDLRAVRKISQEHYIDWTRKAKPQPYDVVLSRRCNPGETAYIPPELKCALGQNLVLLRADGEKIYPPFLRWLVRGPYWWDQIGKYINVGAVFDSLKCADIPNFEVSVPSLADQRAIASILSALDDKIELNRQINQTLEQIAQTLFKSWFVDFGPVKAKIEAKAAGSDPERAAMCAISGKLEPELDQLPPEQYQQLAATAALFPYELVESELGLIPVGWSFVTLDSLSTKISKGTTPTKQDISSAVDAPEIPFIKVKDIGGDGELNRDGIEKIPDSVHRGALKRSILNTNDILFSIAGTIGRIVVVEKDLHNSNANQAVAFVRLKNSNAHLGLCIQHLKCQRLQAAANAAIVQGVQANLSLGSIGNFKILLPNKTVLVVWNDKYRALFDESRCLAGETRALATLRDALLLKLLSGELLVGDCECPV